MVWKIFLSHLMELSATAMMSANIVEMGTVTTVSNMVFPRQVKNPLYCATAAKLPNPNSNVAPPISFTLS